MLVVIGENMDRENIIGAIIPIEITK